MELLEEMRMAKTAYHKSVDEAHESALPLT
jgi:hypothetical protein